MVGCFPYQKRSLGFSAAALALALLSTTATLAGPPQYSFKVISMLDNPLPGVAGGTFVHDFEAGSISSNGDIAFGADVSTGGEGIFLRRHGSLVELARTDGNAPGGGKYGGGFLGPVAQNDQGDAVFDMLLDPPAVPLLGGNAGAYRYSHTTGTLSSVVTPYVTPAPGGGTFQGTFFQPVLNNRGDIVFGGLVATADGIHVSGEPYIGVGVGLYGMDNKGKIAKIIAPGDAAPAGGVFDFAGYPWINDGGDVAFIGHLKGEEAPIPTGPPQEIYPNGIQSLYLISSNGALRSIAHAGDPSPCGQYRLVGNPVINNGGDLAFNGDVTPSPDVGLKIGVFVYSRSQINKVACPGDAMPGGGRLLTAIMVGNNMHMNNRSDVVFSGVLDTGETGVFLWSHGRVSVVARSGMLLPGIGTIEQLGSPGGFPSGSISNDRGQVVFQATLTDASVVFLQATPDGWN